MPKIWMIDYNLRFEQFFIWTMIFFSRLSIGVVFEDEHHVFHHHPILVHFHSEFHYDVIMMTLPWRHFISDGHGGEFQFLQTRLSPFSIQSHCLSPFIYSNRNPWTISGPWFPPSSSFLNSPIKNFQKKFQNFPNKNVISALQKKSFYFSRFAKKWFYRLPRWWHVCFTFITVVLITPKSLRRELNVESIVSFIFDFEEIQG